MSGTTIQIDRLSVAVHGVSTEMAQAALSGLDAAVRRRLGRLRGGFFIDVPSLDIGAVDLPAGADAAGLRDLIADLLVDAVDGARKRQESEAS